MTCSYPSSLTDIRRPGRVGDLIIPVLDPIGEDRLEFIRWMLKPSGLLSDDLVTWLDKEGLDPDFSSAGYSRLYEANSKPYHPKMKQDLKDMYVTSFHLPSNKLVATRLFKRSSNCNPTLASSDPNITETDRNKMEDEIRHLELLGIR